jgi:SAM-dependent methyltransferase
MSFDAKTNRNPFFEQMEKEVMDLIDPETQAPFKHLVKKVSCPVCSHPGNFFLKKWGFTYEKCIHCGLIFVNPRLTEEATIEAYRKGSKANALWASSVNTSTHQIEFYESYFTDQLKLLRQYRQAGTLLDIGCGNGQFLSYARDAGFKVMGAELEENALNLALEKGLDVAPLMLTDRELNSRQFDVITMFGVLEHLMEPRRDINIVNDMLSPGGIFMGITPNAQSLVGMLLHEKARFYTPRNHPHVFSFDSIRYLFQQTGFNVIHLDTVLTGYDSIVNSLQYIEPFSDLKTDFLPPKLKQRVVDKSGFEKLILDWDLGLRLRIIAEKKKPQI